VKPTNAHETEIVDKVDQKARAIQAGRGAWDQSIITDMRIAIGFEMTEPDQQFLESYVHWRRRNPI
jgi:hypothetical protein